MSQKKNVYNEAEHESDSRRMMEHINQRNATYEAEEEGRSQKQMEERVKTYRKSLWRYIGRIALIGAAGIALHFAMKNDLISPLLVTPVSYVCTYYSGWCLCKVIGFYKKLVKAR